MLVNIAASALTDRRAAGRWFGDVGVHLRRPVVDDASCVIVFAEVLPKTLAINAPEPVSRCGRAADARLVVRAVRPAADRRSNGWSRSILRLFGIRDRRRPGDPVAPHEELRGTVDLMHGEMAASRSTTATCSAACSTCAISTVSDVMVHRTEMMTVNADDPPEEIVDAVLKAEFTRMPLWRDTPENIVGILHAKDLLRALQSADGDLSQDRRHGDRAAALVRARHPPAVGAAQGVPPPQDPLRAGGRRIRRGDGLVTLEDILEEIVGDITDEHDIAVPGVRPQPDGSVNVDGAVPIRDLNRAMDWNLPDEEATTIAGLVIHEARSIPDAGPELHLPRLPLQRAAQAAQPHHGAAHHAAGAQARADGAGGLTRVATSCRVDFAPAPAYRGRNKHRGGTP